MYSIQTVFEPGECNQPMQKLDTQNWVFKSRRHLEFYGQWRLCEILYENLIFLYNINEGIEVGFHYMNI